MIVAEFNVMFNTITLLSGNNYVLDIYIILVKWYNYFDE